MNRKKNEQNNNEYERVFEIKKKISKIQFPFPQTLMDPRSMFSLYFNYHFINQDFSQNLKPYKIKKIKNWLDDIPILVGIEDFQQKEPCAICLLELNESNVIKILKCNHFFHQECINEWLQLKPECPTCRDKFHK